MMNMISVGDTVNVKGKESDYELVILGILKDGRYRVHCTSISFFGGVHKCNGYQLIETGQVDVMNFSDLIKNGYIITEIEYGDMPAMTDNQKGCTCKMCNTLNEWAESNQDDGSYICYNCRS